MRTAGAWAMNGVEVRSQRVSEGLVSLCACGGVVGVGRWGVEAGEERYIGWVRSMGRAALIDLWEQIQEGAGYRPGRRARLSSTSSCERSSSRGQGHLALLGWVGAGGWGGLRRWILVSGRVQALAGARRLQPDREIQDACRSAAPSRPRPAVQRERVHGARAARVLRAAPAQCPAVARQGCLPRIEGRNACGPRGQMAKEPWRKPRWITNSRRRIFDDSVSRRARRGERPGASQAARTRVRA